MIDLQTGRQACTPEHAEAVLMALQDREGLYLGVDAGIAGLHPLQAVVVEQAALRIELWGDGVTVQPLSCLGEALLGHASLSRWCAHCRRGAGRGALALAREFLACFAPSPDVLLLGALPFEAHLLAGPPSPCGPLGVLYLPERLLRRSAAGHWEALTLALPGTDSSDRDSRRESRTKSTPTSPSAPQATPIGDDHAPGGYALMVRRALDSLRASPLVSLTLSQSYRRTVSLTAAQAFARLRRANPAPGSFFFNDGRGLRLFGASPDLQLVVRDGVVHAMPVCGTVARRPGAQGEAESLRELLNEEVDAAALAVCSDALRNDLAPLCEPGSLRLLDRRRPMSLATVVHAVDRLAGTLRPGADAWDAIAATAAPVMLTGTPRDVAIRAIADLEASPRGWYGGMIVQVASNGDALVATILRAAAVRGDVAEVRTGGDLLSDSNPEREEAESRLKTRSLWRAFGLDDAGTQHLAVAPERARSMPAVRLSMQGDAFAAALSEFLQGQGLQIASTAEVCVLAGDLLPEPTLQAVVAIGDAAYRLLQQNGVPVDACLPEHGRALDCTLAPLAPITSVVPFAAARYARHRLVVEPTGWEVWARDAQGEAVVLLRGRQACVLYRPESLLSDDTAASLFMAAVDAVQAT